jgi:DUF4097 and DUF4098 domain-containing protein YvlB
MPGKKPPSKKPPPASEPPAWQVILEEIRSENRATIEAVQSSYGELKRDILELREDTKAGLQVLEAAVRQNSTDIRTLQGEVRQNSADIRTLQGDVRNLAEKVDNLSDLEVRVATLERQRG